MEKEPLIDEKIQQLCQSIVERNFGDVMVVGGGISGIQASLDLATAKIKSGIIGQRRRRRRYGVLHRFF